MKKGLLFLFVLLGFGATLMLNSCEKNEEASPVTVNTSITATISGQVTAQLIQDTTDVVLENAPEGTKLLFKIAKTELNPEAPAGEYMITEVTVNASGSYSVSLPTTDAGVTVTIIPNDFTYDKTMWDWNNDDQVWESSQERKIYTSASTELSVVASQNKVLDFHYSHN